MTTLLVPGQYTRTVYALIKEQRYGEALGVLQGVLRVRRALRPLESP